MSDKVSIITPCYNGEKYLEAFLGSVLIQTWRPVELIFVDDGSTDRTKDIFRCFAKRFDDAGIVAIYKYQENAGAAAAINQGLSIFTGDYLMWVDSDDILYPDHIEKKVLFLKQHQEFGFVLCQGELVNATDIDKCVRICKRDHYGRASSLFADLITGRNVVYNPGVIMVRRSAFESAIPNKWIYESRQGQNWQLMLPIAYTSQCGYIDIPLYKIVEHGDSHSRRSRSYKQQIDRNLEFEKLLLYTIQHIVQMPENEKDNWCSSISAHYTRENLRLSHHYIKLRDSILFLKSLKVCDRIKFSDTFCGQFCTSLKRKSMASFNNVISLTKARRNR